MQHYCIIHPTLSVISKVFFFKLQKETGQTSFKKLGQLDPSMKLSLNEEQEPALIGFALIHAQVSVHTPT